MTLTTCGERVKHVFRKNVYQLRETLLEHLNSVNVPYFVDRKSYWNAAKFNFESISAQEDNFCYTDTTFWLFASISSNLIEEPNVHWKSNPGALVEPFVNAPVRLATQSKARKYLKFLENDTSVKSKLNLFFISFH